jgi:hypothetical protein
MDKAGIDFEKAGNELTLHPRGQEFLDFTRQHASLKVRKGPSSACSGRNCRPQAENTNAGPAGARIPHFVRTVAPRHHKPPSASGGVPPKSTRSLRSWKPWFSPCGKSRAEYCAGRAKANLSGGE